MMKETIAVRKGDGSTSQVVVGDVLGTLPDYLPAGKRVIVITDANVYDLYAPVIDRYEKIVIGQGEGNKTHATLLEIYERLLEMEADRGCFILGFGGGIVTDIAGFVATTYMRGVRFGFVATTLLAQVDASIGGKNGVNVGGYKNMVGTFSQPGFVLCDPNVLRTLPKREFRAGLAEIVKAGLIADPALFALFENHFFEDFSEDGPLLLEAIARAIRVKKQIVEADEREAGERRKLNLGHTFAHAIEKSSRRFLHGEAVAIGTVTAARVSCKLGLLDAALAERIRTVIERMGFPVDAGVSDYRLAEALRLDKKKEGDEVALVLLRGVGDCVIRPVPFDQMETLIAEEE
ncbi:MAG: 3-dehydroquinate synthase [Rikenellaceae bacterium]|jgi:3-dehydroquinate synthase|nr:3-dehydroquinate synthase [Rikenellaceae bacterium]